MEDTKSPAKVGLTVKDVIERYGISRSTVNRLLDSGELPARKFGRKVLFDIDDLNRWWESLAKRR